jgi:methionine synthase II (cobalamin-independent)
MVTYSRSGGLQEASLYAELQAGRRLAEELRRVEDDAIRGVIRMQKEIGLEGVTDGEFRRGSWHILVTTVT